MKNALRLLLPIAALAALALAVFLYLPKTAQTSDHQDSPLMISHPGADLTDLFIFGPANPNNVVLAMDVHPLIPAGEGNDVFFDPTVMYQFKIATVGYKENHVIQFRASGSGANQQISMYGPAAPNVVGTRSTWVRKTAAFPINHVTKLPNGMMVYAGPRQDPFYFDLAQFFKIIPDRNYMYHPPFGKGVPPATAKCFRKPGIDTLQNYNVLSFIVQMPRKMLARPDGKLGIVRVYTTTSLKENGQWTQVERLGRPAVKEAFEAFERHDSTNKSSPWNDPLLPHDILAFMESKQGAHRSGVLSQAVVKTLIPDEMEADLSASGPADYLGVETKGKSGLPTGIVRLVPNTKLGGIKKGLKNPYGLFGGRDFSSPVINISLGVIFGSLGQKVGLAPEDNQETACLTSDNVQPSTRGISESTFPYAGKAI